MELEGTMSSLGASIGIWEFSRVSKGGPGTLGSWKGSWGSSLGIGWCSSEGLLQQSLPSKRWMNALLSSVGCETAKFDKLYPKGSGGHLRGDP